MSKFYKCSVCGNIIGKIHDSGVPVVCCGKPMDHLEANTVEASFEKHIPDVKVEDGIVKVQLEGHCAGCPHAQMTVKNGIESFLKENFAEVKAVEAVNMYQF